MESFGNRIVYYDIFGQNRGKNMENNMIEQKKNMKFVYCEFRLFKEFYKNQ